MPDFKSTYSLVTGSGQGIGRAFAEECARLGMNVAMVSLPGENLPETAREISEKYKVKVVWFEGDLSLPETPQAIAQWTEKENIGLHMLVNNAGFGTHGPFLEIAHEKSLKMLSVHVNATYSLTYLLLPNLLRQSQAWIINMGSMAGVTPTPYKTVYAATKGFILWMSRALGSELKKTNVRVSCVVPGGVVTNEKVKARIEAAGWLAKKSAVYPDYVARLSIKRALKGKAITIPGFGGKIGYLLSRYLPTFMALRMLEGPMSRRSE